MFILAITIVLLADSTLCTVGFSVPDIICELDAISGLRITLPFDDDDGITEFTFHGRLRTPLDEFEPGTLIAHLFESYNHQFTYAWQAVGAKPGNQLFYWVFVQHKHGGYMSDVRNVTLRVLPAHIPVGFCCAECDTCERSETVYNGAHPCAGALLFDEQFNKLSLAVWQHEQRFPLENEDNEFLVYKKEQTVIYIADNKLVIRPTLRTGDSLFGGYQSLPNGTCSVATAKQLSVCQRQSTVAMLPPIVSAKITTRHSFRFKYGKIEVVAKLPSGKWLFPIIQLEPYHNAYGRSLYESGVMRMAFARGNDLRQPKNARDIVIDAHVYAGLLLSTGNYFRYQWLKGKSFANVYGNFHTFTTIWSETEIVFSINNTVIHKFRPNFIANNAKRIPNAKRFKRKRTMQPFDQEFYVALGVGVGGRADFNDNFDNKPWRNSDPKQMNTFWRKRNEWTDSWTKATSLLTVDSVRIYALDSID